MGQPAPRSSVCVPFVPLDYLPVSASHSLHVVKTVYSPGTCHSYNLRANRTACMSFIHPACHSYSLRVICTAYMSFVQPTRHLYSLRVIRTACVSFVQPARHSYSLCVIRTACVSFVQPVLMAVSPGSQRPGWLMPVATLPGLPTLWQLEAGKTKGKDGVTTVTACAGVLATTAKCRCSVAIIK